MTPAETVTFRDLDARDRDLIQSLEDGKESERGRHRDEMARIAKEIGKIRARMRQRKCRKAKA